MFEHGERVGALLFHPQLRRIGSQATARVASAVVCQDRVLIGEAVSDLGVAAGIAPTARDQQQAGPATAALKIDVGAIGDDSSCSETRADVPLL